MLPSRTLLVFGLVLLVPGCGGDPDKPVRVTGVVRSQGKPVPGLVVHFVPEKGRESLGTTDASGSFRLKYERNVEGALRGKHRVYVEFRPRDPGQEAEFARGKMALPAELKTILDHYGRNRSTLSYDVTENDQSITIDLD